MSTSGHHCVSVFRLYYIIHVAHVVVVVAIGIDGVCIVVVVVVFVIDNGAAGGIINSFVFDEVVNVVMNFRFFGISQSLAT